MSSILVDFIPFFIFIGVAIIASLVRWFIQRKSGELRIASLNGRYWVEFKVKGKWIKAYYRLTECTPNYNYVYKDNSPEYFKSFDEAKMFANKIMANWGLEEDKPVYVDIVKH